MKKRFRKNSFLIYMTDEELKFLEYRMKLSNISNREHYIRKMALTGHILQLKLPEINRLLMLLSNSSNNLNQIARRVNSGSSLFSKDIYDLREDYKQLWTVMNEMLNGLSGLSDLQDIQKFIDKKNVRSEAV